MVRRLQAGVVLGAALLAVAPAIARAATLTVNTTADPGGAGCAGGTCSIRQALGAASAGDTIVIPAAAGHYLLTRGQLTDTTAVTIQGAGQGATVIDAGGAGRVITVDPPASGTTAVSGLTVTGGSVTSSGPTAGGGGILFERGSLALSGVSVTGNAISIDPAGGDDGGGGILDDSSGTLTLSGSAVSSNAATLTGSGSGGGGIFDLAGPLVLIGTSIDSNSLTVSDTSSGSDGGGGIYTTGPSASITGSTIAENTANVTAAGSANGGGGLYDETGSSAYLNDTLGSNTATVHAEGTSNGGGAIFHEGAAGMLSDLTIAQNSTNASGGGIFDDVSAYTVKNTIVANNGTGCAGPAGVVSAGNNLEGSATCNMTMPGDLRNTDPQLGPLTNNGGSTLTQALTPGSPAIDAGSCTDAMGNPVTTDERGVARPQPAGGRCDIGAYEYVPSSAVPLVVGGSRPVVLSSTRASFSGVVNPSGLPTTARFEYGLDGRYLPAGSTASIYNHFTPAVAIPGGYGPVAVSAAVTGLIPAALYHVRLIVSSGAGTVAGPDQTFVTSQDPPPPGPVLGRFIDAAPVSGLVRVKIGAVFIPLTEPRQLPVGTMFDARQGAAEVTAAGPGGTMAATLNGPVFRVSQPARGGSRGQATATIADGAFSGIPGYTSCRGRTSRVLQALHALVGGGFRISGRFSAALARSGQWATSDRCDGTLTKVRRGPVLVTNLPRGRTVTVRTGHTHLAAKPKR